ncbi:hypothetical protein E2C01_045945 [Portunus trituberculatus]|uniref:Uncharacterized protein n=1 Tax=Portunus trituberculatus TaxID=210409 RepID=A0A5B7G3R0_PORTR|nr:hypothetical protein [Portunus trituberculatus]
MEEEEYQGQIETTKGAEESENRNGGRGAPEAKEKMWVGKIAEKKQEPEECQMKGKMSKKEGRAAALLYMHEGKRVQE